MLTQTELKYLLALQRTPNLGDISIKKLLSRMGSAENIFKEKNSILSKVDGIGAGRLSQFNRKLQLEQAEEELKYIEGNDIRVSFFQDSDYPERLKHCIDGPVLLFGRGNIDLKGKRILSIVGTRKITTYGRAFCQELIADLAPLNPVIVSGLAYGVDICAHRAALEHNLQTIGCLAHGLNQVYPRDHKKYMEAIERHGGFFTEFWSDSVFDRNNFLRRNRVIAGLSEATVVIESGKKGGSLVTAEIAVSYDREVFAVPGRTTDSQSQGCLDLIKQQKAHLLTSAADIIYHLDWKIEEKKMPVQTQLFVELNEEEKKVFRLLKEKERELLDIIAIECDFPVFKAATVLMNMELKGVVKPLPGKLFQLA